MENLKLYESFVEEINESKVKKGLMHDLLNIPQDKKISDVYKNTKEDAEELAHDLLNAVKKAKLVPMKEVRSKATSMLAFAGNWPSEGKNTVIDKALKAIKKIEIPGVPIKINEIHEEEGFVNEDENYTLPIQQIGSPDFDYDIMASQRQYVILTGQNDRGQKMRPIQYKVTASHPAMGTFDLNILSLNVSSTGYMEGKVKPDSFKWQLTKRVIPSRYLSGDYLKIKVRPSQIRDMLKMLASRGGRNANMKVDNNVELYFTKNREL